MKEQKEHLVIISNFGTYWAGLNTWTDQIRKAQFYNSEKKAIEAAKDAIERHNKVRDEEHQITSYKLLTISFNILKETEWKTV